MLRKKYKVIDSYYFIRIKFDGTNSICENCECEFCGPDFEDRFCESINIKKKTLIDICIRSSDDTDNCDNIIFSYIPDPQKYRLKEYRGKKKIERKF